MEESNKEKFLKLVSDRKSDTMDWVRWRIENRCWLRESRKITTRILTRLDQLGWSKLDLAEKMGTDVNEVSGWVSGSFKFSDDLLRRLESDFF